MDCWFSALGFSTHPGALVDKESNEKTLVSVCGRKRAGSSFRWSPFQKLKLKYLIVFLVAKETYDRASNSQNINSAVTICLLTDCLFRKSAELLVVSRKCLLDNISLKKIIKKNPWLHGIWSPEMEVISPVLFIWYINTKIPNCTKYKRTTKKATCTSLNSKQHM